MRRFVLLDVLMDILIFSAFGQYSFDAELELKGSNWSAHNISDPNSEHPTLLLNNSRQGEIL